MKKCVACDSETTSLRHGKPQWRYHDGHCFCKNCYMKYVYGPTYYPKRNAKWNPINNPKYNPRRIYFSPDKKQVLLDKNPRKGSCKLCGNKIGDTYINTKGKQAVTKQLDIHHIKYDNLDVNKHTIECCHSCHMKEHRKNGRNLAKMKSWS